MSQASSGRTMHLVIITPYKRFFEGEVVSLVINTVDGLMGFMPGHPPVIVAIRPGMSHLENEEGVVFFSVSEGYCEVSERGITVICNAAEFPEELSPRRTCKSYKEARAGLEQARLIPDKIAREVSIKEYELAIDRARARRHLIELHGSDHQKERMAVLREEYGWTDLF